MGNILLRCLTKEQDSQQGGRVRGVRGLTEAFGLYPNPGGSHGMVLSEGLTPSDFCPRKHTLGAEWGTVGWVSRGSEYRKPR